MSVYTLSTHQRGEQVGAESILLLTAVIAIGVSFVAILIIKSKNELLSLLTIKAKPKAVVVVGATVIIFAVLLVANTTNVNSLAMLAGENKERQGQNLTGLIKSTTLKGNETFWHNIIKYNFVNKRDVNYIEAKFRVLGQNQTEQNHAGIVFWITDPNNNNRSKGYYTFLRHNKLAVYTGDRGEIQSPRDISRENGKWFTLKIVYINNTINLFLNGKLQMQVHYIPSGGNTSAYISKVGIQSYNSVAEFEPIEIGTVNITKMTSPLSRYTRNELHFVPAYMSLQFYM
jgi:hypothetical protein